MAFVLLGCRATLRAASAAGRRYASSGGASGTTSRVLVIGASGQIGSELVPYMRSVYGRHNVIATDVGFSAPALLEDGPFAYCDCCNKESIAKLVVEHRVDTIVHLASLLSAVRWHLRLLRLGVDTSRPLLACCCPLPSHGPPLRVARCCRRSASRSRSSPCT